VYVAGPVLGAALGVLVARLLRGRGSRQEKAAAIGGAMGEADEER
jgi:hypothetical protein